MYDVPARTRRSQSLDGLGQGAAASAVAQLAKSAGRAATSQIRSVVFRSQISPDIEIDPVLESVAEPVAEPRTVGEHGLSELFLRVAKPAFYIDTNFGVLRVAPWGEPKLPLFPLFVAGTIVGGFVLAGFVVRRMRRS